LYIFLDTLCTLKKREKKIEAVGEDEQVLNNNATHTKKNMHQKNGGHESRKTRVNELAKRFEVIVNAEEPFRRTSLSNNSPGKLKSTHFYFMLFLFLIFV
jgi:hypothetical protein